MSIPTEKKYPPRRISRVDSQGTDGKSSYYQTERRSPEATSPGFSQRYKTTNQHGIQGYNEGTSRQHTKDERGSPSRYNERSSPTQYNEPGSSTRYNEAGSSVRYNEDGSSTRYNDRGISIQYNEGGSSLRHNEGTRFNDHVNNSERSNRIESSTSNRIDSSTARANEHGGSVTKNKYDQSSNGQFGISNYTKSGPSTDDSGVKSPENGEFSKRKSKQDQKLSNSISIPKKEAEKLNQSVDRLNTSPGRKDATSTAIPGLNDYENKKVRKSPDGNSKTSKSKNSSTFHKQANKETETDFEMNLDTTGEKARLLSVRRLDTSDEPRRYPTSDSSDSSSMTSDGQPESSDVFLPKRYILALMMFLGFVNMYAIRVNLNVAIGAMVKNHTIIKGGVAIVEPPEFNWSSRLQGVVLGSFYYGYMVLQIPGGYCAMRYGGTNIFGGAIFIASILTLLTPFATRLSVWALISLRVLEGLSLGVMLPCNHQIWSLWAPLQERTTLVTIALAGMNVGTVVTMPLTGLLTKYGFDGGWASVFYCFGAFGILWSLLWFVVVHATPSSHPTITVKERKYIERNVIPIKTNMKIPWRAMLTSRPVWGVIVGNIANDWGLYTILICLPLFLMDIMKFNVQTMGFIASLPFLLKAIVGPIGGVISDVLRYKYMSTANARRLFYILGAMSAATMIVIAGYSHTPTVAVLSMCVGVAMSGLLHSGYEVNVLDIAPSLSGIVMGISNTLGTTTGFLSPLLVGYMTENKERSEWILVFWITFFIYLVGTVMFCLMLSGEPQHWSVQDEDDDEETGRKSRT